MSVRCQIIECFSVNLVRPFACPFGTSTSYVSFSSEIIFFILFGLICANCSVKYNVKVIRRILEIFRENSGNSELGVG